MPPKRKDIIITPFGEAITIEDFLKEYITLNARLKKLPYNSPEYFTIQRRLLVLRPLLKQFPTQL